MTERVIFVVGVVLIAITLIFGIFGARATR